MAFERSTSTPAAPLVSLDARVREISFQSPDTGYTVLQAKDPVSEKLITVVGDLPTIKVGDQFRFQGHWIQHPRFGKQFRVQYYESLMPATREGIEAFLASGLIKGIGPATARRIVAYFGDQTLQVLDHQPERLEEVPSIGSRKREQILVSWQERRGLQPIVEFLQRHGLAPGLGPRLYREYGAQTLQILQNRPYDLTDTWGIGFETADSFARAVAQAGGNWQPENLPRLQAGLKHVLRKATHDGHLYLPLENLLDQTAALLKLSHTLLVPALEALFETQELYPEPHQQADRTSYDVYLRRNGQAEQQSAERLSQLLREIDPPDESEFTSWLDDYQQEHQISLALGQQEAVQRAATSKVFILTGGPGTGKTTVSKAILSWFKSRKLRCRLASPTGRAARRLSEVTGEEAVTLHRLLEFDPHNNGFQRDESFPLACDVLLLDEVSMIDMPLFASLLRALPDKARLILIGDRDQLPSVGPGAVLAELLDSGVIPAVQLTEIYRQAAASRIVQNAHLVNQGHPPALIPPSGRNRSEDAFFIATRSPEETLQQLLDLVARRLPAAGHEVNEIQVLCPMKRGPIGTQAINAALQDVLNPPRPERSELHLGGRIFRQGDRVIQLKNNYDAEVFNGDLGKVMQADPGERRLEVAFSEKAVEVEGEHLGELDLAYALTIHKSQGAEFPVVVMVLTRQHHVMLQRNLLYTGMTRAQKLLILLGDPGAIQQAVQNDRLRHRNTRLGERLQRSLTPG